MPRTPYRRVVAALLLVEAAAAIRAIQFFTNGASSR